MVKSNIQVGGGKGEVDLARSLMDEFCQATGLTGSAAPRRYLWTDACAVCNLLGLARDTRDNHYMDLARTLVDHVHYILGRHREDDPRHGWISGLSEAEGRQHPTAGGLRIGKPLNERSPNAPFDSQLEWERDGQYFHYLTKWMRALHRMAQETQENRYVRWAIELAIAAHKGFVRPVSPGGTRRLFWKMSIDLTRPLVASTGQHDPLDGVISYRQLQTLPASSEFPDGDLATAIAEWNQMCTQAYWATDDLLGIGGLLDDAARLVQLVYEHHWNQRELLFKVLVAAEKSLAALGRTQFLSRSAEQRLAFRELGLSIGLAGLFRAHPWAANDPEVASICQRLLEYVPLRDSIQGFWVQPTTRQARVWLEHADINNVMLATSLCPVSYLQL